MNVKSQIWNNVMTAYRAAGGRISADDLLMSEASDEDILRWIGDLNARVGMDTQLMSQFATEFINHRSKQSMNTIDNKLPTAISCKHAKALAAELSENDNDWTYTVRDHETYSTICIHDEDGNFLGEM